jgi:hypothetical protein
MSPQDTLKSVLRFSLLLFTGLITMSSTGCVISQAGSVAETEAQIPVEHTEATNAAAYRVEMSGGFNAGETYEGQLHGPLFVQDALERSGATKRYRSMDILIYRIVEETGRGLKLPVEYNSGKKSVMQNQNYALHPNDRIVVTNRSHNAIDKIIDSINPLD